ncbi:YCF48-related protein [Pelomonas sp. SE-A7]|uniref:YCF48-related protein n=1 Tax=Pelomonas sp. SE-A7 TaxID=3054953 RepID=UPI00259CC74B|nr:YCF48-related protein [Pelomonas sp. SE-A7]MDM4768393.1 YCF48-related protein [Pelomonas sp. SE-A7]
MNNKHVSLRAHGIGLAAAVLLAACGGGDDSPPAPTTPPVTAVPESLSLTAPAAGEAGTEFQFGNSASGLSGLTFAWDFGDGKQSSDASPKHSFSKGGDYEVVLKVSNSAGASREQRIKVSVTNLANVKGLVCSGASSTGWCWQQPKPTGNERTDLLMLSATSGFMVGENGEIFRTTDAGTTWTAVPSGVTSTLRSISFSSDKDGWIVGDYGALLRTSDGGATWTLSKIAETDSYYNSVGALQALDANTAIMGVGYSYRYTSDGGKTWATSGMQPSLITPKGVFWSMASYGSQLNKSTDFGKSSSVVMTLSEPGYSMNGSAVAVFDESVVMLSSVLYRYDPYTYNYEYKRVLRRSEDGGASWTRIEPSGLEAEDQRGSSMPQIMRASATDKNVVAAFGSSVYRSADGGSSWKKVSTPSGMYSSTFGGTLALGNTLLVPSYGTVYRSEDLGQTWTAIAVGTASSSSLWGLKRINTDTVTVRSSEGSAYVSGDQGKTWKRFQGSSPGQQATYVGGGFFDGKHGFLLSQQGEMTETTDGGLSWKTKLPGLIQGYGDMQVYGDKLAWLLLGDGRFSRSTDGGASWSSAVRVGQSGFRRIGLVDDKRAWAAYSYSYYSSSFALTSDGGQTWTDTSPVANVQSLYMGADLPLLGYGNTGMIATSSDNGKTWSQRYSGTQVQFLSMTAAEAGNLWVVGEQGVVRRSIDKGQSWTEVNLGSSDTLNHVAFANAKVGWIAGNRGTVFATTDGGKTWARQLTGTLRHLSRIIVVDAKTAWALGDGGTVLATGNGGF